MMDCDSSQMLKMEVKGGVAPPCGRLRDKPGLVTVSAVQVHVHEPDTTSWFSPEQGGGVRTQGGGFTQ